MRDSAGIEETTDGGGNSRRAMPSADSGPTAAVMGQAQTLTNQRPEDGTSRAAAAGARHYWLAPLDRDSVR